MEREAVVPLRPRSTPTAPPETAVAAPAAPPQYTPPSHQAPPLSATPSPADRAFVGTLAAIAAVLGSRLLLLLAILGAFALAIRATGTDGLFVLIAYAVLVILPLVALDIIAHKRGGT